MNFSRPPSPSPRSGYALILIMVFLAVSLITFASIMSWVSTSSNITLRNNAFTAAEAAAESCTENWLASMIRDFSAQSLNSADAYSSLQPDQTGWPIQYAFSNISVTISPPAWQVLNSQFIGLFGSVQNCTNMATAIAINGPVGVPGTVQQAIQFANIPVFQYAMFYNMDLEICPGRAMTINGHVHSNGNIWTTGASSSELLTYTSYVEASGGVFMRRSPNDPQSYTTGNVVFQLTQNNPLTNVDSLSMPIGTNNNPASVSAILAIPPAGLAVPNPAAYSPTGLVYLYNAADLIIANNSGGTNFTVLYNNQNATPQLIPVAPDVAAISTNAGVVSTNFYYSFLTNATFYDYRESDTVQAIQLNVSNLVVWLTNSFTSYGTNRGGAQYNFMNSSGSTSKGHGINSVYVYNSVPRTTSQLPAVRLVNGQQLPSAGFTVATAQPLYVQGNYNIQTNFGGAQALGLGATTNRATVPAALMGDAITILSSSWSDSYNSFTPLTSRNPVATTINAAALEGIVPSFTDGSGQHFSGGVENFLRMLENWSGVNLNYNGSIVVMFPSQYATNLWISPGTYYYPPIRNWGFDVNYAKGPQFLPPLTPQAKYIIRSSWAAW